jgi:putative ABC transport system substrate-binding protein
MITRRKLLLYFGLGTLLSASGARAQQAKVRRIGFLGARSPSTPANPDPYLDALMDGLRKLGYVEGKNLIIEWRFAEGNYDRLAALAAELVKLKPELIISHTTPGTAVMQKATSTIPIVVTSVSDPVAGGFAKSLARPGGNITGMSIMTVDVSEKLLELLKTMLPKLSSVAVLMNPGTAFHPTVLKNVQAAAQPKGVQVMGVQAGTMNEVESAFQKMAREGVHAAIVAADSFYFQNRRPIAEIGNRHRVPAMYTGRESVEAGGLISYGTSIADSYRRAATYVDKILKGAKPADLPIEQATTFHLAINARTAKALGLNIPQELRLRADEVIE